MKSHRHKREAAEMNHPDGRCALPDGSWRSRPDGEENSLRAALIAQSRKVSRLKQAAPVTYASNALPAGKA
jgi:hypothetical protein